VNPVRVKVKTQSGSEYVLDYTAKTWERLSHAPESNQLRTEFGTFEHVERLEVGKGVLMLMEPLTPGATGRMVYTSDVTEINPA